MYGEFTVCGVGWVRDLVFVLEKVVWTGAVSKKEPSLLMIHGRSMSTIPCSSGCGREGGGMKCVQYGVRIGVMVCGCVAPWMHRT